MATPTVTSVYVSVIEDVINKVRDEFVSLGVGENVLNELQGLWEVKMMQCGAITGSIERIPACKAGGPTPVHDLNVPYEGTEEYETPTAEMLFPPTPIETPMQTPLPGMENSLYQLSNAADVKSGRPIPYMQAPSPWMSQRPLCVDVNIAYEEGRDEVDRGAPDQPLTQDFFVTPAGKRKRDDMSSNVNQSRHIPQQDGAADQLDDFEPALFQLPSVASEGYNTPAADQHLHVTSSTGTPKPGKNEAANDDDDDDEPSLNEDDDDDEDLDELEREDEEPSTHHLVLAQFDKVTRTKSRWKCTLKDGIMHFNNKDILFNKANGEFEF